MDQKRKVKSVVSFIALRNLTIESAPIIPRDIARFALIPIIITATIRDIITSIALKPGEYITPEYVFLYTKYMKSPIKSVRKRHRTISSAPSVWFIEKKSVFIRSAKVNLVIQIHPPCPSKICLLTAYYD